MDFLDPKKRRAHSIRLMIGYFLMAILLLLASTILFFVAFGYGINRSTGEVTQNGLLFVDAHPQQAKVLLNAKDRGNTDGRYVLEAGTYNLELQRDGYRSWKRDFTLDGGVIVRLVYPFMFPEVLESKNVIKLTDQPDIASSSPDRRWIVVHSPSAKNDFFVVDTSSKQLPVTNISIPETVLGNKATQRLEAVEWSTDNEHLLIKHHFEGGTEYVLLDRNDPEESINITEQIGKKFTTATLRDKRADQFYILNSSGSLEYVNIKDATVEQVATSVTGFWPYKDDTVLYTTNVGAAENMAAVNLKEGEVTYAIREVARADAYLLNIAEFDDQTFVGVGSTADGRVYVYKNPIAELKKDSTKELTQEVLLRVDGARTASFSTNARFLSVQGGKTFSVYDFETRQQYNYAAQLEVPAEQKATWMDGHRIMLTSEGKTVIFDYDGTNTQTLVDTVAGSVPLFDRDYNRLFTVSPQVDDASRTGLIWTDLNLGVE